MYTTYHSRKQIREKSKIRYIYVILGKGNYRENVLTFTDRKGTPSNSRALMINDDDEDENDDENQSLGSFWNLCMTNEPILQCIIVLRTWFFCHRLYP